MIKKTFRLLLKGRTAVYIDWANVYGWTKSLKRTVDPKKLFKYLHGYKDIKEIKFYYGTDQNPKSKQFIKSVKNVGFKLITKPVKHILIAQVNGKEIYKRKCDFDMEISLDIHSDLDKYESFIFFTGDGDFEPLYRMLSGIHKQVIVIYAHGHLGREVWEFTGKIFKRAIDGLDADLFTKKNAPPISRGARLTVI